MKELDLDPESNKCISRRKFCCVMAGTLISSGLLPPVLQVRIPETKPEEDLFAFMNRTLGTFDRISYQRIIGEANDFKEGDQILGVAAAGEAVRAKARRLLSNIRVGDILKHPLFEDNLYSRLLKRKIAESQRKAGHVPALWVHVNDVAGFIGPEVFRTREQLVRCCLEDIVMGKLHGLTIGLDICSTMHMDVSLDDLDWCQNQVMPANPAYLMALPTKNGPMLGYLTTAYQDHVRLREKFGYKVNDTMWKFFQRLDIIDAEGRPTSHFGDSLWVWYPFRRAKGDKRSKDEIIREGKQKMKEVRGRSVYLAEGFKKQIWKMEPGLDREIHDLYVDAKKSIWVDLEPSFVAAIPNAVRLKTRSADRTDYILHPQTGEVLDDASLAALKDLKGKIQNRADVQIVISDGLNAHAIMDKGHLAPYLFALDKKLIKKNLKPVSEILILRGGRVRAGYRIGEILFGDLPDAKEHRAIIHHRGAPRHHPSHFFRLYDRARRWCLEERRHRS